MDVVAIVVNAKESLIFRIAGQLMIAVPVFGDGTEVDCVFEFNIDNKNLVPVWRRARVIYRTSGFLEFFPAEKKQAYKWAYKECRKQLRKEDNAE